MLASLLDHTITVEDVLIILAILALLLIVIGNRARF